MINKMMMTILKIITSQDMQQSERQLASLTRSRLSDLELRPRRLPIDQV